MSTEHLFQYRHKVKTPEEIAELLGPMPRDKKAIMCHGVFDIVHPGHMRHLLYAKSKVDVLVVSLTADRHITKANARPYVPQDLRALNLAAFEMVDYVVIDENPTPIQNLKTIQPNYFAKGYEYTAEEKMPPKTLEEKQTVESYGGEILFTPGDIVYSSSHIIENTPPNIATEKLLMLLEAEGLTFEDLRSTAGSLDGMKVHILGDTIVDTFTECSMIGGMTKTPTMSVRYETKQDFTGGAAIVAKHMRAAGAEVVFTTVLGDDEHGRMVIEDLEKSNITCDAIIDPTRPTTNKNAIIVGDYRLLKIDTLDNRSISDGILAEFCEKISETEADATVFSDFRHGIFNQGTIPTLTAAIPEGRFRVADSQVASRWGNIADFQGFDLITPNEREARFALGDQDSVIRPLGSKLYERANCKTLMLKMGSRGMITFRAKAEETGRFFFNVDSTTVNSIDPVGAGDALMAYATLTLKKTGSPVLASIIGTIAAGMECEHHGNYPITVDLVQKRIDELERRAKFNESD